MNGSLLTMPSIARPPGRQSGFSLIELMIAITLGLVILAALTSFFVQTSGNRTEMERNTRQIENGRYAIDAMREDIGLAGFFADTSPLVTPAWVLNDVCPPDIASYGFSIAGGYSAPVPVRGYAAGAGAPAGCLQSLVPNSDVIGIRRFGTEALTPAEAAAVPTRWYLQNSQCTEDDPLIPLVIATGAGPFPLQRVACGGQVARVWRMREQIYYLRTCSTCDPVPDGVPTLWRAELGGDPAAGGAMRHSALVEGIEMLRFDYGIDTDGDGMPNLWSRCDTSPAAPCDAAGWSNVTAVKVYVLSRTLEESREWKDDKEYNMGLSGTIGPIGDKYKRHVYSAVIVLPNRTGSREPRLAAAP
jgi:type IV pilus assembly protein PilW